MSEAYRIDGLKRVIGYAGPTIYMMAKRGDFMQPVRLSKRHSIWPANEVSAWLAAKARGASDDEIRALVKELQAQRTNAANAA